MRTILHFVFFFSLLSAGTTHAQTEERPFIWVRSKERAEILLKIETQAWAKSSYDSFVSRLDTVISSHSTNPDSFIRELPFDWENQRAGETPPFPYTTHIVDGKRLNLDNATEEEMAGFWKLVDYLQMAIDCGVAYYLSQDEKYAQCALDILHASVQGIIQLEPSDWAPRGGWLCPDDLLRESREIGDKLPIIYDFVAPFINSGGKPYDIGKKSTIDFPAEEAQQVFRTYAELVVNHGGVGTNHPVLEAPCLVYNALALDKVSERNHYLKYYLTQSTPHQDALSEVAEFYKNEGDIWPETSQYINGVASRTTLLMFILTKYDPTLHLGQKYPNIPLALQRMDYLVYPNGELILWGDGHRNYTTPYESYEIAYQLGKLDGVKKLTDQFGALLGSTMTRGKYERKGMRALLWYSDEFEKKSKPLQLPRTDRQPHAGIFLQRNLSTTGDPEDGLMSFVGGASMVHGHASGMNIELYGEGHVLGVDNGRGRYAQDIHENYSRLFAAHNTVIVNGASQGEGDWVNLGMNTVQLAHIEPWPGEEALSEDYSFTRTTFKDDKGDKAEATQERTLMLVRTSPTSGYYVDVFRSKSALPNEYHDYLYHNLGDSLLILNEDMLLRPEPKRYQQNANLEWIQNRQYRNPGWHFFKKVRASSPYSNSVQAVFTAKRLNSRPVHMRLCILGDTQRTYTTVEAPPTFEAPQGYSSLPTPTLIIRKEGEAWQHPFVVVYEPYTGDQQDHSIQSVEKLEKNGIYHGLKVVSKIQDKTITQWIINPPEDGVYEDRSLNLRFEGRLAILTLDESKKLQNVYVGEGQKLVLDTITVEVDDPVRKSAYVVPEKHQPLRK